MKISLDNICEPQEIKMSEEAKTREEVLRYLDETLGEVGAERDYQYSKWNDNFNDDCWMFDDWKAFINKYLANAEVAHINFEYSGNKEMLQEFKKQMIKVAALAVACVEAVKRNEAYIEEHGEDSDE